MHRYTSKNSPSNLKALLTGWSNHLSAEAVGTSHISHVKSGIWRAKGVGGGSRQGATGGATEKATERATEERDGRGDGARRRTSQPEAACSGVIL